MNSLNNEEIKFTLPKINNFNANKNFNFVQKVFEENKVVNKKLIIDSVYSPFRKFEYLKENQNLKTIKKSFSFVNKDMNKNNKIFEDIENMIESFKNKEFNNLKTSTESENSLLNTMKNFVNNLRKKELAMSDDEVPSLGRKKQNEFLKNLIKSEKVHKIKKFRKN